MLIEVGPLDKPAGQRCKFQAIRGCGIYARRPDACRVFSCAWLKGLLPNHLRPDKVGAVFWATSIIGTNGQQFPIVTVNARPGRLHPDVLSAALNISRLHPVTLQQSGRATMYQDGAVVVAWRPETEFFKFDIDRTTGRFINASVVAQTVVFANDPAKAAEWHRAQRESITVPETGEWKKPEVTP